MILNVALIDLALFIVAVELYWASSPRLKKWTAALCVYVAIEFFFHKAMEDALARFL